MKNGPFLKLLTGPRLVATLDLVTLSAPSRNPFRHSIHVLQLAYLWLKRWSAFPIIECITSDSCDPVDQLR